MKVGEHYLQDINYGTEVSMEIHLKKLNMELFKNAPFGYLPGFSNNNTHTLPGGMLIIGSSIESKIS